MKNNKRFHNPWICSKNRLRTAVIGIFAIFLALACGCGKYASVPVTILGVKDYVFGQQQSFSCPLNQVLAASVYNLRLSGFEIDRIEHFNEKGLVLAKWQGISAKLSLESITSSLTRISSKVRLDNHLREYSSEEELFGNIRNTLQKGQSPDWGELTQGLVKVYLSPDKASPVIAYLGPGTTADRISEEGNWCKIALMDKGAGYVALKHLELSSAEDNQ